MKNKYFFKYEVFVYCVGNVRISNLSLLCTYLYFSWLVITISFYQIYGLGSPTVTVYYNIMVTGTYVFALTG